MGWWITLGILVLLAVLPLGVSVRYNEDGLVVKIIAGPVKITLFPRAKKEKEEKEPSETKQPEAATQECKEVPQNQPQEKEQPQKAAEKPAKKSGGSLTDFMPLVQIALEMLDTFRRRLRVNLLELKLILAADDPCDLAVNYGRAWTAVGNLMPRLERVLVIKKRNIEVECDFEATETKVIAGLDLTITLGRIFATVVVYGIKALIEFMKIKNKRKGGASK